MSAHDHVWSPIEGAMAQYGCACGVTGYRATFGPARGEIVQHKEARQVRQQITARPSVGNNESGHRLPACSTRGRR